MSPLAQKIFLSLGVIASVKFDIKKKLFESELYNQI